MTNAIIKSILFGIDGTLAKHQDVSRIHLRDNGSAISMTVILNS